MLSLRKYERDGLPVKRSLLELNTSGRHLISIQS